MKPLTQNQIENAFIKKPKDVHIPNLENIDWKNLEYFSWSHRDGSKSYIVAFLNDRPLAIELTMDKTKVGVQARMCSLCHTIHTGNQIALFSYSVIRPQYKTFGDYFCSNLACSNYLRGAKTGVVQMQEDITVEDKILRLEINLEKYLKQYVKNTGYKLT